MREAVNSLCRTLAAVGLFEYTFVVACLAALARWTLFGADAFHLEPATYSARAKVEK